MGNKKSVQKYLNQDMVWDQDYNKLNKELIATNKFLEDPNFPQSKAILCDHDFEDDSIAKEIESGTFTEGSDGVSGEISKVGDVPDFDSDRKLFKVLRKTVNDKAFIGASPIGWGLFHQFLDINGGLSSVIKQYLRIPKILLDLL